MRTIRLILQKDLLLPIFAENYYYYYTVTTCTASSLAQLRITCFVAFAGCFTFALSISAIFDILLLISSVFDYLRLQDEILVHENRTQAHRQASNSEHSADIGTI
jgi:hypothetical protein